jgi:hypothetical protein
MVVAHSGDVYTPQREKNIQIAIRLGRDPDLWDDLYKFALLGPYLVPVTVVTCLTARMGLSEVRGAI